jgi:DNA-binding NtrC family response regulator
LHIYADKYKRQDPEFSGEAYEQMLNYNWRGNVRELQHVIERAILLSKGAKIDKLSIPKNMENHVSLSSITNGNGQTNVAKSGENRTHFDFDKNLSGEES